MAEESAAEAATAGMRRHPPLALALHEGEDGRRPSCAAHEEGEERPEAPMGGLVDSRTPRRCSQTTACSMGTLCAEIVRPLAGRPRRLSRWRRLAVRAGVSQ